MKTRHRILQLGILSILMAFAVVHAEDVGMDDILKSARRWIAMNAIIQAELPEAEPSSAVQMTDSERNPLPLWRVDLTPTGYLIMSADDTLPPVIAFDTKNAFTMTAEHPLPSMLKRQGEIFLSELEKPQTRGNELAEENKARWKRLLNYTRAESTTPSTIVRQPMLTTEWNQNAPYNYFCPSESTYTQHALTGCVATAAAQMMKYHEWPVVGRGTKSHTDNKGDVQGAFYSDFSIPYDWEVMNDSYLETSEGDYSSSELEVARLSMELGVLVEADYGMDETSASSLNLHTLMAQYLGYSDSAVYGSESGFYSRIRKEMVEGRPAFVTYTQENNGHMFIVDGLGTMGGLDYYHFNYGWGGHMSGWYLLTDGFEASVVDSATTNIQPQPVPVFKQMSCEQTSSFTLSWDFPKRLTAEAFRLTKITGTRSLTVISSSISGSARNYTLTGQSGTATYVLEAKVNGSWQAASEGVTVKVKANPATMLLLTIEHGLTSIACGQVTTTITANNSLSSMTVTSSRPDILPSNSIEVSGSGLSRTVKLTPEPVGGDIGNVLLYVVATDTAGNIISQAVPLHFISDKTLKWYTTKQEVMAAAAKSGKLVLMVASSDTCNNTKYFRNTVCEISDIKSKIFDRYELCYVNMEDVEYARVGNYMAGIEGSTPHIAIIDPSYQDEKRVRGHKGFMSIEDARVFLDIGPDYHFSLINDVTYFIHDGLAEIMACNNPDASVVVIPEKVEGNVVTKILYKAFENCANLTKVTLPEGITIIEYKAFMGCANLTTINLPNAIREIESWAFYECSSLSGIVLPQNLVSIGDRAFWYCSSLTNIFIPKSVTAISRVSISVSHNYVEGNIFAYCTSLKRIDVDEENPCFASDDGILYNKTRTILINYPAGKTDKVYRMPETVVKMQERTFSCNKYLENIILSDNLVNIIPEYAFIDCEKLVEINIPNGVSSIGGVAFGGCSSLISITIPDSVTSIKSMAFSGCSSLLSLALPARLQEISGWVFQHCSSLKFLMIPDSVEEIDRDAFVYAGIEYVLSDNEYAIDWFANRFPAVRIIGMDAFIESISINGVDVLSGWETKSYTCTATWNDGSITPVTPIWSLSSTEHASLKSNLLANTNKTEARQMVTLKAELHFFNNIISEEKSIVLDVEQEMDYTPAEFFEYSVDEDNFVTITKFIGSQTEVIIPPAIDGMPVIVIGEGAFRNNKNITAVTVGNNILSIECDAFRDCDKLASILLSDNIIRIKECAFYNCESLTSVTIPDSVIEIRQSCFSGCINLKNLHIGKNLESINRNFEALYNLVSVQVDDENKTYLSQDNVLFSKDMSKLVLHPAGIAQTEYTIPFGVKSIENGAFFLNHKLKSIVIPESVTSIGKESFSACTGLSSMVIPDSVVSIGSHAFYGCSGMKTISIGDGVKSINSYAFYGCSGMKTISIGDGVTSISNNVFDNCTKLETVLTDNEYVINWFEKNMPNIEVTNWRLEQTLNLSAGWNWVSFFILPNSRKVGDVLGTAGFAVNDVIQTDTGSSRFNGISWIPSNFTIDYGKLYMVNVSNPMTIRVRGTAAAMESLAVISGWNWIANPTDTVYKPSLLGISGDWTAGDCIQGATKSVRYSGRKWIPSTGFTLEPGRGYQLFSAKSGRMTFSANGTGTYENDDAMYLVVDLSGGPNAENYPVRYTDTPPNLDDDTCRTTELWLRRIPAGKFIMGSAEKGLYLDQTQHEVTLTKDYYIGVFECTQKQWELVYGSKRSAYKGDCRPVEQVRYQWIRGGNWPTDAHIVNTNSMIGLLQKKTGLTFDLPTEAQWEYACRAGTTTDFNSGKNLTSTYPDSNMDEVGRYYYNQSDGKGGYSQHTIVGKYLPNAWGLYDMHGNVCEFCLDLTGSFGADSVEDPLGPNTGTYDAHVHRGGAWSIMDATFCNSAYRTDYPEDYDSRLGFRLVCLP